MIDITFCLNTKSSSASTFADSVITTVSSASEARGLSQSEKTIESSFFLFTIVKKVTFFRPFLYAWLCEISNLVGDCFNSAIVSPDPMSRARMATSER